MVHEELVVMENSSIEEDASSNPMETQMVSDQVLRFSIEKLPYRWAKRA